MMREIWIDEQGVYRLRKPLPDAQMHLMDTKASEVKAMERDPAAWQDRLRHDYWETERSFVHMQRAMLS